MNDVNLMFENRMEMMAFLKGLKPKDHFRIAKDHGLKPSNKEEANLLTDYIVQGVNNGLSGEALIQYAKDRTARLIAIMPHLGRSNDVSDTNVVVDTGASVRSETVAKQSTEAVESVEAESTQGAAESASVDKVTPVSPVAPGASKRPRKVSKTKHADGTIVPRLDRGGFEVWVSGKAEAFRPTVEKCIAFMTRKYPDIKTRLVDLEVE
jgi:hypothetical protein